MDKSHANIWRLIVPLAVMGVLVLACSQPTPSPSTIPGRPSVFIVAPVDGGQVALNQPTVIQANATDAQGVSRIEIKVDGVLAGTVQSSTQGQASLTAAQPWTFTQAGRHVIGAQAFNVAGQASDLAAISVTAEEGIAQDDTPGAAGPTAEATSAPGATTPALSADMEADTNRVGMDYKDFDLSGPDPELCRSACLADSQCLAYTYVKPEIQGTSARCWLKSSVPPAQPDTCCISGVKSGASATPLPTAEPTRTPRFVITVTPTRSHIIHLTPTPTVQLGAWKTYRTGDKGPGVFAIQYLLLAEGYSLTVDGTFSPETESTVKSFQGAQGLSADGVVGPKTWTALTRHMVHSGSNADAVRAVQYLLKNAYGHDVAVDGTFGSKTEEAVKSFQTSRGLSADGIVGSQTWKALIAGL